MITNKLSYDLQDAFCDGYNYSRGDLLLWRGSWLGVLATTRFQNGLNKCWCNTGVAQQWVLQCLMAMVEQVLRADGRQSMELTVARDWRARGCSDSSLVVPIGQTTTSSSSDCFVLTLWESREALRESGPNFLCFDSQMPLLLLCFSIFWGNNCWWWATCYGFLAFWLHGFLHASHGRCQW